jgi:hypothetical protein
MADPRMESIERYTRERQSAGTELEAAFNACNDARSREDEATRKLEEGYSTVLASGFMIGRIVDLEGITYFAGYTGYDPDNSSRYDLELDEEHAKNLEGAFAYNASVRFWPTFRDDKDLAQGKPQPKPRFTFTVNGEHNNQTVINGDITPCDRLGDGKTEYSASLEAVEWRLPTEKEIQKYAGSSILSTTA